MSFFFFYWRENFYERYSGFYDHFSPFYDHSAFISAKLAKNQPHFSTNQTND